MWPDRTAGIRARPGGQCQRRWRPGDRRGLLPLRARGSGQLARGGPWYSERLRRHRRGRAWLQRPRHRRCRTWPCRRPRHRRCRTWPCRRPSGRAGGPLPRHRRPGTAVVGHAGRRRRTDVGHALWGRCVGPRDGRRWRPSTRRGADLGQVATGPGVGPGRDVGRQTTKERRTRVGCVAGRECVGPGWSGPRRARRIHLGPLASVAPGRPRDRRAGRGQVGDARRGRLVDPGQRRTRPPSRRWRGTPGVGQPAAVTQITAGSVRPATTGWVGRRGRDIPVRPGHAGEVRSVTVRSVGPGSARVLLEPECRSVGWRCRRGIVRQRDPRPVGAERAAGVWLSVRVRPVGPRGAGKCRAAGGPAVHPGVGGTVAPVAVWT
jgi:hypothetical protein